MTTGIRPWIRNTMLSSKITLEIFFLNLETNKLLGANVKIKQNADGSIARYKARLVAKDFHKSAEPDYSETFSLVVNR